MAKTHIGKTSMPKAVAAKAPHAAPGVAGPSSRSRINEAAGVKVKPESTQAKAAVTPNVKANSTLAATTSQKAATAGPNDPHVMPAKHPGAKTTAVRGKAAWDD